jgi:hypothetical protein
MIILINFAKMKLNIYLNIWLYISITKSFFYFSKCIILLGDDVLSVIGQGNLSFFFKEYLKGCLIKTAFFLARTV